MRNLDAPLAALFWTRQAAEIAVAIGAECKQLVLASREAHVKIQ
jgi:hypothetical protein